MEAHLSSQSLYPLYILLIILLIFSALFSAAETSYSSVNIIRLKNLANSGDKSAKKVLKLIESYEKTLSTVLIGNNIVNIASAAVGTLVFTRLFGDAGVGIATAVMTVLVLIFGEVLPKTIAKTNADRFAALFVPLLKVMMFIFTPLLMVFIALQKAAVKVIGNGRKNAPYVTEEELMYIIDEIKDEGILEESEGKLAKQALEFDNITVEEIVTPRVDIKAVSADQSNEEILEILDKCHYSRLPVYEKNIDNITGLLYRNDFYENYVRNKNFKVADVIRQAIYVPQSKNISEMLQNFQRTKLHMAIVTDEYGGTLGLVTLEDVLEELVGEIWDERDETRRYIIKQSEQQYLVKGEMNIYDLFEELHLPKNILETDSNTVGGFVLENIGKIPVPGDTFFFENLKVTVVKMEANRVAEALFNMEPMP